MCAIWALNFECFDLERSLFGTLANVRWQIYGGRPRVVDLKSPALSDWQRSVADGDLFIPCHVYGCGWSAFDWKAIAFQCKVDVVLLILRKFERSIEKFMFTYLLTSFSERYVRRNQTDDDVVAVGEDRRRDTEHSGVRTSGGRSMSRDDRLSDALCADRTAGKRLLQRRQTAPGSCVCTRQRSLHRLTPQPASLLRRRHCWRIRGSWTVAYFMTHGLIEAAVLSSFWFFLARI